MDYFSRYWFYSSKEVSNKQVDTDTQVPIMCRVMNLAGKDESQELDQCTTYWHISRSDAEVFTFCPQRSRFSTGGQFLVTSNSSRSWHVKLRFLIKNKKKLLSQVVFG